jgi:soluble lytic murein transglycosylase-like protein
VPPFSHAHLVTLSRYPGAVRALKLAQIGQMDMARLELALLDEKDAKAWREALASLAVAALKPDAAIQVAALLEHPSGGRVDTALYPIAPWSPKDGYRLDPALINAFIRQESRFKPAAVNKDSGAAGLLQMMPRTARAVDRKTRKDQLTNPETSMTLGQKYLEELLGRTDGNLFEAAIAYNAGPGNLAAWKDRFADVDDPLLFIELVPYGETRAYVERVMANYWIYSLRMGPSAARGVASLDAVAGGRQALYSPATNRGSTQIVLGASR